MKEIHFENLCREAQNEITEWMIDYEIETQIVTESDPNPDFWLISDEDAEKLLNRFDYPDLYVRDEETM